MPYTLDTNYTYLIAIRHENPSTDPEETGWRFGMFTGYDGADWADGLELSDRVLANNFVAQYKKSNKKELQKNQNPGKVLAEPNYQPAVILILNHWVRSRI